MITGALAAPVDLDRRVSDERYARLLGYPNRALPEGRVSELAAASRLWFARHARPWAWVAPAEAVVLGAGTVELAGGRTYESRVLVERLKEIGADRLLAAVVSAGSEVDEASARLWREERPDEAFFLDRFGAAAAIQLGGWVAERLRQAAADEGLGLGPGYSPGYDGWDLADQVAVVGGLIGAAPHGLASLPGALSLLDSGMLEPKNSLVATFGLTRRPEAADRQWQRHSCSWCSLTGCTLRGSSPAAALGS